MLESERYRSYVGQYVKRFYTPFKAANIYKIVDFRVSEFGCPEYLYCDGEDEWWSDCEDSFIITNEIPIKDLKHVANVNHEDYVGFNPFTGKLIISNILN